MARHAWNRVVSGYYDPVRNYDYYDGDFRDHYTTHYSRTHYPYTYYQPAYRYGYRLASDPRYRGRSWEEIEADARDDWAGSFAGAWDDFKAAIRYAWDQVKAVFDDRDYDRYRDDFERHYNAVYTARTGDYDDYAPAYRLGYDLSHDDQYHGLMWSEVEPLARQRWEADGHDMPWDEVKEAVQYAWERFMRWAKGFGDYRRDFQQHYDRHYQDSPRTYADYEAAYSYGHTLAVDENYRGRPWSEIEPDVRARWEEKNEGTWEEFKDAVRHAWDAITGADTVDDEDDARFREQYRVHYETNFADSGYPFSDYERAYRYGYRLYQEPRYLDLDWPAIEPELRQYWESEYRHQMPWDRYRDAAYYGWDLARMRIYS
jgi:hypothetical protein